jgi:hypothetical protein
MSQDRRSFLKKLGMIAGGAAAAAVPQPASTLEATVDCDVRSGTGTPPPQVRVELRVLSDHQYTGVRAREVINSDGKKELTYTFDPGFEPRGGTTTAQDRAVLEAMERLNQQHKRRQRLARRRGKRWWR